MLARRKLQFRLGTILLIVLLAALVTRWYGDSLYVSIQTYLSSVMARPDPMNEQDRVRRIRRLRFRQVEELLAALPDQTILDQDVIIGFPPSYAPTIESRSADLLEDVMMRSRRIVRLEPMQRSGRDSRSITGMRSRLHLHFQPTSRE